MDVSEKYHGLEVMSDCVSLLGVSVLSFCLSQRVPRGWRQWKNLSWGRVCILLVLLDSWFFVFFSGLLSSGIGLWWSHTTCSLATYTCISFYALSKVLIYAFLSEKVYIVWTGGNQIARLETKVYRVCAFFLLGYFAVAVLMVIGQDSRIRDDGVCVIGLKSYSTIALIAYDILLNIFLTLMFVSRLWISHPMNGRLKSVAKRTLYGACTSLLSSTVNILILFVLGGNELAWICLSSCVTDVMVNSLVLFWVSSSPYPSEIVRDRYSLPTMDMGALTFGPTESSTSPTSQHPTIPPSNQVTFSTIPEAYYDYIPSEQRNGNQSHDPEKQIFNSPESPPIGPDAPAATAEEKDICDQ